MKVLQLGDAAQEAALDLHPQVTVVTGLDAARRAWLVDALGRLAAGGDPAGTGRIEAHGIRMPLDAATLALLELGRPVAAVVTAADLPGHDPERAEAARARDEAARRRDQAAETLSTCRAALTTAVTERDDAARVLDELARGEGAAREALAAAEAERARLEAELASAGAERGRAEAALAEAVAARDALAGERAVLADRLEAAQARRRAAIEAAAAAAAALEEARSGATSAVDPIAAVQAAQTALAEAEAAAGALDPTGDDSPVTRRLADLERRRAELARIQLAMGPGTASPVAVALDAVLGASSEAPPVVAALALADTWRDLHQQINALEAGVSPEERAAEERVAMCRQAVVEAEADFNQPVLTPEQIAKVEAVHAEALEAQDRTEGRFGGARARKRLEEARNEERRVLERLGFSTYADYMMSASSRGSGPANRSLVEAARNQLAASEAELANIPGAADRARRRTELLQRRDAVAPRVADLLGHEPTGPEAEEELRNLREPMAPNTVAVDQLAQELRMVGIDVGDEPYDQEELALLARAYLAEERAAEAKREETEQALAALDRAIDELRTARNRGVTELPALAPLPPLAEPVGSAVAEADEAAARLLREARWAEVESARARLAEAQDEAARHREANAALAGLEDELAARTEAEAEAAQALADAQAALEGDHDARLVAAGDAVAVAEAALARATAAEADARAALGGSGGSPTDALLAEARGRAEAAEARLSAVAADEQRAAVELAEAESAMAAASAAAAAADERAAAVDRSALVADIDWELMARLAAVRSVGLAGSVPLVLDDALSALTGEEVAPVLDRIAQLAGAVQVVVVSDDPSVAAWARAAGDQRAAVLAA